MIPKGGEERGPRSQRKLHCNALTAATGPTAILLKLITWEAEIFMTKKINASQSFFQKNVKVFK